ncbi:MAG: hypothetical protein SYC29_17155 [Planctomycetota bacterium]|nr:hypothetical protein [Planctomycetota bacterium]
MIRSRVFFSLVLLAMSLCGPAGARGEPNDADPRPIDLAFPGGSVAEYVEALRGEAEYLNIIVMPEVAQVRMEAVELRQVDPTAAVSLLHGLQQEGAGGMVQLAVDRVSGELFRSTVYTVSAIPKGTRRRQATDSEVWSLAEILQADVSAEDVLTAVETALDMFEQTYEPTEVRFHRETGLLIAYARPDQIEAVDDVVSALTVALRSRAPADRGPKIAELETQLAAARGEVEALRHELVESETRMKLYMMEIESLRKERKEMGEEMRQALAERDSVINSLELKLKLLQLEQQESAGDDR